MTPKPTKAGSEALVRLLATEMHGEPSIPADELSAKVVDGLLSRGLVRYRVELTEEGRLAAHEAADPNEDTPA